MGSPEAEARKRSNAFLNEEKAYRLGFVEAEQSNPKTRLLGETTVNNTAEGVKMLLNVDKDLIGLYDQTIRGKDFDAFYRDALTSLRTGGRIVISGCGSTGRLAMRVEASWRTAVAALCRQNRNAAALSEKVLSLMTGGDYAVIRAVESFEDYIELGEKQTEELHLTEKDILVGVTATGETTSVLGTARRALADGAKVWMIVCSDPEKVAEKLARARDVFHHAHCRTLYIRCGGMAVTGSTRMQSSTIEQALLCTCLELCLSELFDENKADQEAKKDALSDGFRDCIHSVCEETTILSIAKQAETEAALYKNHGLVTYFADEYLLDALADTTERGPTFCVPPFLPSTAKDGAPSWSFVKNPTLGTAAAWEHCFGRTPRCVTYTANDYRAVGIKEEDVRKIPKIDAAALYAFKIGSEPDPAREGENTLATWIGYENDVPRTFFDRAKSFEKHTVMTLSPGASFPCETRMHLFEHLAVKIMLNTMSTATMAKAGRIYGNYMVYMNITNKKLIDRATRIIADLCHIDYEKANYELFLSKAYFESVNDPNGPVVIETVNRLRNA